MTRRNKRVPLLIIIPFVIASVAVIFVVPAYVRRSFRQGAWVPVQETEDGSPILVHDVRTKGNTVFFEVSLQEDAECAHLLTEIRKPSYCVRGNTLRIEAYVHEIPSYVIAEEKPVEWFDPILPGDTESAEVPILRRLTIPFSIEPLDGIPAKGTARYVMQDIAMRIRYGIRFLRLRDEESFYNFEDEYNNKVRLHTVDEIIISVGYIQNPDMALFGQRALTSLHDENARYQYTIENQGIATGIYKFER